MNNQTVFHNPRTGETVTRIDHSSGLTIFVWPKAGYQSHYAVFGTNYGSIDTAFDVNGTYTEVPAGIAHYLEHKLFENEDCDAFQRYAATGADANAFTSFERTAYLFSGSGDIVPSLEILLDFVQAPYFTEATVEKERGIIGQEIRMYDDTPGWRVFFNLLQAMYQNHPVRTDIAGTVDSIARITPDLLYGCYNAFYNLHNMVLAVAGNVTVEQVSGVADRLLKPAPAWQLTRPDPHEPKEVGQARVEQKMTVAAPLFYFGFKHPMEGMAPLSPKEALAGEALLEILAGHSSPLYTRLMKEELINRSFGMELFDGPGYAAFLFGGESRDPDAVAAALCDEVDRLRRDGIDPAAFEAVRNALYGSAVMSQNDVEDCGDQLMNGHFRKLAPFEELEAAAALTREDVEALLQRSLCREHTVLSIIRPR